MQLAAEMEFCARRLEVATVARGRKPQSLQDFLCAPAAHVSDMTAVFTETETLVILTSWVVVDAVLRNQSPQSEFPANRENNREYCDF